MEGALLVREEGDGRRDFTRVYARGALPTRTEENTGGDGRGEGEGERSKRKG